MRDAASGDSYISLRGVGARLKVEFPNSIISSPGGPPPRKNLNRTRISALNKTPPLHALDDDHVGLSLFSTGLYEMAKPATTGGSLHNAASYGGILVGNGFSA